MVLCIISAAVSIALAWKANKREKKVFAGLKGIAYLGVAILTLIHLFRGAVESEYSLTAAILMAAIFEVGTNYKEFREELKKENGISN